MLSRAVYDCVIIGSTKRDTFEAYDSIAEKLSKNAKVVYIDGGDEAEVGGDASRLGFAELYGRAFSKRAPDVIFKREYLKNKNYPANVYPLPLAYGGPLIDGAGGVKKYDVVFWAVDNIPVRAKVLDFCEGKWDCGENGTSRGQTFKKYNRKGIKYLKELAASKVCYNFRGGGWDTLRYWEIPAVGSLMVSGKPGIVIPDDFEHGKHAVFCKDDLSDLEGLTNYYLKRDKERECIAAEGKKHLLKYHLPRHRAEYLLDVIEKRAE
ncbi:MAG: glycosyltransferase family 1 protein [Elusimicrobia bacterium HGW-Elusimicrobia-2]|nr:MAG: glycosyltransferase family 1 protein [Elusimicrobia bacterium HGW-Elusimicrobia-2]